MQDLKVVIVQADQKWEDKKGNFANYTSLLSAIKETDLIVLPEMFHTGFSMNVEKLGEKFEESEGINWLKKLADDRKAAVYTSLIIQDKNEYYNRGVFVYPNGNLEYYDKRKSFCLAGEDKYFSAGNNRTIVEYKGWKIQLQICYDLRFPEIARNEIDTNGDAIYDVLIYVANWPERRSLHWKSLLQARAIENQCYVIGVNRCGQDGSNLSYSGDSSIISPLGEKLIEINFNELISEKVLAYKELINTRKALPFLKDK